MAIATVMTTPFKAELLRGNHDLDGHAIKAALYTASASLGTTTAAYTAASEITGTGYTTGGKTLTGATISSSGAVGFADFADLQWTSATFTARGTLFYNDTHASNGSISSHDFGTSKSVTSGTFTLQMPAFDSSNAIIRIA